MIPSFRSTSPLTPHSTYIHRDHYTNYPYLTNMCLFITTHWKFFALTSLSIVSLAALFSLRKVNHLKSTPPPSKQAKTIPIKRPPNKPLNSLYTSFHSISNTKPTRASSHPSLPPSPVTPTSSPLSTNAKRLFSPISRAETPTRLVSQSPTLKFLRSDVMLRNK